MASDICFFKHTSIGALLILYVEIERNAGIAVAPGTCWRVCVYGSVDGVVCGEEFEHYDVADFGVCNIRAVYKSAVSDGDLVHCAEHVRDAQRGQE